MSQTITQIVICAAIVYMTIAAIGNAHNRGYIEGCKDTREGGVALLKAWEIGDMREDLVKAAREAK